MQFFLDTADLSLIRKYAEWGIVDGVTTNPSIIAKEGVDFKTRVIEIANIIDGPISAEVISVDTEGMLKEARDIATWHENVFVKIPMTAEGLRAVKVLSSEGIRTNVTLIFSVSQAVMAAKVGASLVSPFIGRLDDISENGNELIADIMNVFRTYGFDTQVIAASIRHSKHIMDAMAAGADIATIPPNLFDKMVKHPLTDKGLEGFLADWADFKKKDL